MPRRPIRRMLTLAAVLFGTAVITPGIVRAADPPPVEEFLITGKLADGEAAMQKALEADPKNHQARFSLGVVQVLRGVERLSQSQYRHGLDVQSGIALPFMRLPVPENPKPEVMTYAAARSMMAAFLDDLAKADATLAQVDTSSDVKLPLHFGRIRLDLNGDGKIAENEALWKVFQAITRRGGQAEGEGFFIVFDAGDVEWLRGYTHLLSALGEFYLAYDSHDLFERCGQLFYPEIETPYTYIANEPRHDVNNVNSIPSSQYWWMDVIAFIHSLNFPLAEPERMPKALAHLEAMIAHSRACWKLILAETDDDFEWLPNPQQQSVIGLRIEASMVDAWHEFLSEAEALLQGKKLIPFWRGGPNFTDPATGKPLGVNLRRVFTEPRQFDVILLATGPGAQPYLEPGELTSPQTWWRFEQVFQGNFFGFAVWIN